MKGFTLIELLAVVMILGILAAVALPQYQRAVEKARATEAVVITKALQDAIQRHMQEFPNEKVTKQGQIAEVKLTGGKWVMLDGSTPENKGDANCFLTKYFSYEFDPNNTLEVRRVDNPTKCNETAKYTILLHKVISGTSPRVTSCPAPGQEEYEYVCSLFE